MIAFETAVRIERPIEEVFAYVSDPLNLPRWNSAVPDVRKTSDSQRGVGAVYTMERELPTGRAQNDLEILSCEAPTAFALRTTLGPTPFAYRYRFVPEHGQTVVQLDGAVELRGAATLLAPLARRAIKNGVDDNFATLKKILETSASSAG